MARLHNMPCRGPLRRRYDPGRPAMVEQNLSFFGVAGEGRSLGRYGASKGHYQPNMKANLQDRRSPGRPLA